MTPKQEAELRNVNNISPSGGISNILEAIYPVGSIYIGTTSTCPIAALGVGTWTLVSAGNALWTGNGSNANTTINAGLPNVTGNFIAVNHYNYDNASVKTAINGAFEVNNFPSTTGANIQQNTTPSGDGVWSIGFNANNGASTKGIYGNSSTVQPPAYVVNVWRRTT